MNSNVASLVEARIASQPDDVRGMPDDERDRLIVSAVCVDGTWVIKCLYGADSWELSGGPSNLGRYYRVLHFSRVPPTFVPLIKAVLYRYKQRGFNGHSQPKSGTLRLFFKEIVPFLRYLEGLGIDHVSAATPMVCRNYVATCQSRHRSEGAKRKRMSPATMCRRFRAVEQLYVLSQFTDTPMPAHPWPDTAAMILAGFSPHDGRSKTPLIPDEVFTALFQEAYELVKRADEFLDMRDALDDIALQRKGQTKGQILATKNKYLVSQGWIGGLNTFGFEQLALRDACYVVVASLSGCRNHELAYVQTGACYRTEEDGCEYWWMRSRSDKTGTGHTEWMVPEAVVEALRVMDRWAAPYQAWLKKEIESRCSENPEDPAIAEMQRHIKAVFLGRKRGFVPTTLSQNAWNDRLKGFAKRCGLDWDLASHQFRRKFANYAARSRFGDLRYLREHFKHWSQDMTNDAYALNESQEMELYAEIREELDNIKLGLAEQWLNPAEPLAGGYGRNLVDWRNRFENVALFKDRASMVRSIAESHAIRSNGHAWCTADDNKCIGNTFEKTRCSGCDNAVIGRFHARLYQQLYDDLEEALKCDDIGPGGRARVERDRARCREVLCSLGYDPGGQEPA